MKKLLRYIETTEGRNKIIDVLGTFTLVGGVILSAVVLAAKFL
jgi:hypothetical protein